MTDNSEAVNKILADMEALTMVKLKDTRPREGVVQVCNNGHTVPHDCVNYDGYCMFCKRAYSKLYNDLRKEADVSVSDLRSAKQYWKVSERQYRLGIIDEDPGPEPIATRPDIVRKWVKIKGNENDAPRPKGLGFKHTRTSRNPRSITEKPGPKWKSARRHQNERLPSSVEATYKLFDPFNTLGQLPNAVNNKALQPLHTDKKPITIKISCDNPIGSEDI